MSLPAHALVTAPPGPACYERLPAWADSAPELSVWARPVLEGVLATETAVRLRHDRLGIAQLGTEDDVAFGARVAMLAGPAGAPGIARSEVRARRDAVALVGLAVVWVPVAADAEAGSAQAAAGVPKPV